MDDHMVSNASNITEAKQEVQDFHGLVEPMRNTIQTGVANFRTHFDTETQFVRSEHSAGNQNVIEEMSALLSEVREDMGTLSSHLQDGISGMQQDMGKLSSHVQDGQTTLSEMRKDMGMLSSHVQDGFGEILNAIRKDTGERTALATTLAELATSKRLQDDGITRERGCISVALAETSSTTNRIQEETIARGVDNA